eukprot:COSAG06_NODE_640_length_13515_cov_6.190206_4_plen_110_part_00
MVVLVCSSKEQPLVFGVQRCCAASVMGLALEMFQLRGRDLGGGHERRQLTYEDVCEEYAASMPSSNSKPRKARAFSTWFLVTPLRYSIRHRWRVEAPPERIAFLLRIGD